MISSFGRRAGCSSPSAFCTLTGWMNAPSREGEPTASSRYSFALFAALAISGRTIRSQPCLRQARGPLFLGLGLAEPVLETRPAQSRVLVGDECALGQLRAEVARVWIGDDFTRIVPRGEALSNQIVEAELFGPRPPSAG
jgi:hypothetical protein